MLLILTDCIRLWWRARLFSMVTMRNAMTSTKVDFKYVEHIAMIGVVILLFFWIWLTRFNSTLWKVNTFHMATGPMRWQQISAVTSSKKKVPCDQSWLPPTWISFNVSFNINKYLNSSNSLIDWIRRWWTSRLVAWEPFRWSDSEFSANLTLIRWWPKPGHTH